MACAEASSIAHHRRNKRQGSQGSQGATPQARRAAGALMQAGGLCEAGGRCYRWR